MSKLTVKKELKPLPDEIVVSYDFEIEGDEVSPAMQLKIAKAAQAKLEELGHTFEVHSLAFTDIKLRVRGDIVMKVD